jgi:hypothetical protein
MNPYIHSKNSANKYGGIPEDYLEVHQFMDSAKEHIGSIIHRLILHNTFGIALAEKVCGDIVQTGTGKFVRVNYITNSDGKKVYIRDIAQDHVREDLHGKIPSLNEQFQNITVDLVKDKLGIFGPIINRARKELKEITNV